MDTLHEKVHENPCTVCWLAFGPIGAILIFFFI